MTLIKCLQFAMQCQEESDMGWAHTSCCSLTCTGWEWWSHCHGFPGDEITCAGDLEDGAPANRYRFIKRGTERLCNESGWAPNSAIMLIKGYTMR